MMLYRQIWLFIFGKLAIRAEKNFMAYISDANHERFRGPTNKSNSFVVVCNITNLLHLDCSPVPSIL